MSRVLELSYRLPPIKTSSAKKLDIAKAAQIISDLTKSNPQKIIENHLNKHMGKNSNYIVKKSLIESFELIQFYLFDPNTLPDTKRVIAEAILHEITECTPGFHTRINHLLTGLTRPESIDEILEILRNAIVERVARTITNEVHLHNRVFMQAALEGYGIRPINSEDRYLRYDSSPEINSKLQTAFAQYYTPLSILIGVQSILEAEFRLRFEYKGRNPSGYKLATYGKIIEFLNRMFSSNLPPDQVSFDRFLQVEEDTFKVEDISWLKIYQTLLTTLNECKYIECTEHELLFLLELLKEKPNIHLLLMNQDAVRSLNLIAYPELVKHVSATIKDPLFMILKENMTYIELYKWFIQFSANMNEEECKQYFKSMLKTWLTSEGIDLEDLSINVLVQRSPFEIEALLEVIASMPVQKQREILCFTNTKKENLIHLLVAKKPKFSPTLFQLAISLFDKDTLEQIVTLTLPGTSTNIWLHEAQKKPEVFILLIDACVNPEIQNLFIPMKTDHNKNLFLLAIKHQLPSAINKIFSNGFALSKEQHAEMILAQTEDNTSFAHYQENCLMLALKSPETLECLLNNLPSDFKNQLMKQKDNLNNNILMSALEYPQSLSIILKALKTIDDNTVLTSFFLEKNECYNADEELIEGNTLLELASMKSHASLILLLDTLVKESIPSSHHNLISHTNYLKIMLDHKPVDFPELLKEMAHRPYGINLLMASENKFLINTALNHPLTNKVHLIHALNLLLSPLFERLVLNDRINKDLLFALKKDASLACELLNLISRLPMENQRHLVENNRLLWAKVLLQHPEQISTLMNTLPTYLDVIFSEQDREVVALLVNTIHENNSLEVRRMFGRTLSKLTFTHQYMLLHQSQSLCKQLINQGIAEINIEPLQKHLRNLPMKSQVQILDRLNEIRAQNTNFKEAVDVELADKMSLLSQALLVTKYQFFKPHFNNSLLNQEEHKPTLSAISD